MRMHPNALRMSQGSVNVPHLVWTLWEEETPQIHWDEASPPNTKHKVYLQKTKECYVSCTYELVDWDMCLLQIHFLNFTAIFQFLKLGFTSLRFTDLERGKASPTSLILPENPVSSTFLSPGFPLWNLSFSFQPLHILEWHIYFFVWVFIFCLLHYVVSSTKRFFNQ